MNLLLYGLVSGFLFGVLLQKSQVLRYDKQVGALLFTDMTIVKYMLTAILTGMIGLYALKSLGLIEFHLKTTVLGGNILGGLVFGLGWGILGYCPGTQLGALGEGRWDALWGILGMILGGGVYAEIYPFLEKTVLTWGRLGKITLPQELGVQPWVVIAVFLVLGAGLFAVIERKRL